MGLESAKRSTTIILYLHATLFRTNNFSYSPITYRVISRATVTIRTVNTYHSNLVLIYYTVIVSAKFYGDVRREMNTVFA